MRPCLRFTILVVTIITCYSYAHEFVHNRALKSENALIISWDPVSDDHKANQVDVSDQQGHVVTSLNVLQPMEDACRVSIYDVSARGNMIAVAAVYNSNQGNRKVRPASSLLLFNFGGQLLHAFALEPSHAIARLAVDDESNIWTLTDHADVNVDPSTVPMVVEYTAEGKIVRKLLTRNMFPFHASDTKESLTIGPIVMGYDSGVVWFWLPGSTDFVTISTRHGKTAMMKTQLPKRAGRAVVPLAVARDPSGSVLVQVRADDNRRRPEIKSIVGYYTWSASTGSWSEFRPGACEPGRLIGADDKGQIYARYQSGRAEAANICTFRTH